MPILSSLGSGAIGTYGLLRKGSKTFFLNTVTAIFQGSQSWTAPSGSTTVDYLIIGGGGGGGGVGGFGGFGAGGGAGGYRTGTGYVITPGTSYGITVGGGGGRVASGSNSGFWNVTSSIWSAGGGCGGSADAYSAPNTPSGTAGGSGGGASKQDTNNTLGTAGQGNIPNVSPAQGTGGGSAFTAGHPSPGANGSGGGGGASANGSSASSGVSGRGGMGLASSITGGPVAFCGGGGGYSDTSPNLGNGGTGGGGNANGPGTAFSGGGGGGGGPSNINGGSGVVILKYQAYQEFSGNTVVQQFANSSSYTMPAGTYWTNATLGSGLYGRRYSGNFNGNVNFFKTAAFAGTSKVYTNINSNWSEGGDNFSVEWLGYFKPNVTGTWTFSASSDDYSYLWVGDFAVGGYTTGNALVVNTSPVNTLRSGTISLISGVYYPIRLQYGEGGGGEAMVLYFTPPNGSQTNDGTGYYFYNTVNNGI